MGWNINISIADIDGFTALHCTYKREDRACVELLLVKGASETVLDALGRAPSHLMSESFESGRDHNVDVLGWPMRVTCINANGGPPISSMMMRII